MPARADDSWELRRALGARDGRRIRLRAWEQSGACSVRRRQPRREVLSVSTRFLTNSIGALVSVGIAQLDQTRGHVQQALDGVLAIVSVWTIIASVVFHNRTLTWLSVAEAL